jgi:hypothetical protein
LGLAVAQLNYQNIWGAPVSVHAHRRYVNRVLQAGYCRDAWSASPGCEWHSGNRVRGNVRTLYLIPSTRFSTAVWHEVVVHVRWAADGAGVVDAWHRIKGTHARYGTKAAWRQTVRVRGYPTVQWSDARPVANYKTYDKIGAYRGQSSYPISMLHDAFCVGSSFWSVVSRCFSRATS